MDAPTFTSPDCAEATDKGHARCPGSTHLRLDPDDGASELILTGCDCDCHGDPIPIPA